MGVDNQKKYIVSQLKGEKFKVIINESRSIDNNHILDQNRTLDGIINVERRTNPSEDII